MFDGIRRLILFLVGITLPISGFNLGSIGTFYVTAFKLMTFFLLVVALMQYVVTGKGASGNHKTAWIVIFFASYTFSSLTGLAVGVPFSIIFVRFTTFLALVMYYFLLTYVVTSLRDLRVLLWAFVLGGALAAFPAAVGIDPGSEGDVTRYSGLSSQSNVLGYDLTSALPVAMALFFTARTTVKKGFAVTCAFLAVMGILLSLSRSAFVAGGGMWALWIVRSGRLDSIKYVIPAVLAGVLLVLAAPEDVRERFSTMTDPTKRQEDDSIQSRFYVGAFAIKAFIANPVIGVGNFGWHKWVLDQPGGEITRGLKIHSVYLAVAAYQGLAGLIPFFVVLAFTWTDFNGTRRAAFFYRARKDPVLMELGHYAMYLQIGFFGNLIANVFSTSLDSKSQWLNIGMSTALYLMARQRVRELEAERPADAPQPASVAGGFYRPPDDAYAR